MVTSKGTTLVFFQYQRMHSNQCPNETRTCNSEILATTKACSWLNWDTSSTNDFKVPLRDPTSDMSVAISVLRFSGPGVAEEADAFDAEMLCFNIGVSGSSRKRGNAWSPKEKATN
jgi:hypothetical protein